MNVSRDHVEALINTLILAYAGVSLPILMLITNSNNSFIFTINREIFVIEILRTLIGSMGFVLTVPIATYLAVILLKEK